MPTASVKFIELDLTEYVATDKTQSVKIDQALAIESNKYTLECLGLTHQHTDDSVEVKLDAVTKAYGWVTEQKDRTTAEKKRKSTVQASDYSWFLNWRLVNELYTNQDVAAIITDILTKHVPEIGTDYIQTTGITLDEIRFNFKPVMNAIQDLLSLISEFHFYVDEANKAHLFHRYEADGPEINKSNVKIDTIEPTYDRTTAVNRVWVVGAKQASENYIGQYFAGDGKQRYFNLSYEPNYTEIYVAGVLKNSKLVENDDGAQDFLIDKKNKVVYIPSNVATPFSGEIKVHYRPTIQLIDYFENAVEAQKKLIEKAIKNQDITDRLEARRFGQAELKKVSTLRRRINCITTADAKIGQRVYFNINHSVLGDLRAYYLVTGVSYTIDPTVIKTGRIEKSVTIEELI